MAIADVRVVISVTPEEALEMANALHSTRKRQTESILRVKKVPITVSLLADALKTAGITDAKLVPIEKRKPKFNDFD